MDRLAQVRFKFLLGELHLHSWRPRFLVRPTPADPALTAPAAEALPEGVAGLWWTSAPVDRFPLGPRRVGPWLRYVPEAAKLFHVRIEGDFETYLNGWSAKARYNLRRSVRKLQERNPDGAFEVFTEPAQMDSFLRQAAAISQETYQAKLLQSGLDHSAETLAAMQALAQQGEGRGYLLRDAGEAIAFAWCAGQGERLTYEVIGYRESAAALSPGSVLLYLILEDLFALQRFRLFDFGVGDAPYKRQFATGVMDFADAYFLRRTPANWLRVHLHWALNRGVGAIGQWLERRGLKAKVKRWIRALKT